MKIMIQLEKLMRWVFSFNLVKLFLLYKSKFSPKVDISIFNFVLGNCDLIAQNMTDD